MYRYDSLGICEESRDMYYVQKTAYKHPRPIPRWALGENQEQLERKLYARLQGHQGFFLPLIGKICRLVFLVICVPYFALIAVKRKIEALIVKIHLKLQLFLIPIQNKCVAFVNFILKPIRKAKERLNILFQTVNNYLLGIVEKAKNKFYRIIIKVVSPFKKVINKLKAICEARISALFSLLERFSLLLIKPLIKGQNYIRNRYRYIRQNIELAKDSLISSKERVEQITQQLKKKHLGILASVVKKFYVSLAWANVLCRYGVRVFEDWTLEMKQWFSLRS